MPRRKGYFTVRKGGICRVLGKFAIHSGCQIYVGERAELVLGDGYANAGLKITCSSKIEIGNGAAIADGVAIMDSDHHDLVGGRGRTMPVHIGNRVWIGTNVIILNGVTIGDGAVIGAGSVVTKSVAPSTLVAGNPARFIRKVEWS